MDGKEAVAPQLYPYVGSTVLGSKGVTVSAPATPKAMPDAEIGAEESWTVTTSLLIAEYAIPYHSIRLEFWTPVQKDVTARGEACHVISARESEMDETFTVVRPLVTIDKIITSPALTVLNGPSASDVPEDQDPDALPSKVGGGGSANSWKENEPAGIDVWEENCGDHRYILAAAGRVNEPAVCVSPLLSVSALRHGAEHPVIVALASS